MRAPETTAAARPVYNRNQGNIQRARINVVQTQTGLASLERKVAAEVEQAAQDYDLSRTAVGQIQGFLDDITDQLQWTVQLPWREGADERHRFDVLRLLRQVPAVVEVTLVDGKGIERLRLSRVDPDIVDSSIDRANDPAVEHGGVVLLAVAVGWNVEQDHGRPPSQKAEHHLFHRASCGR